MRDRPHRDHRLRGARCALLVLWAFFALPSTLRSAPPTLALNGFSARGVSDNDAAIVADRLRAELLATSQARVLEREQMDLILQEQSFSQTGACDQSQCAIELGRILSVDHIVLGSIGKIGELFTLQTRVLDVSTGEIILTRNLDFRGRIEDLLVQQIPGMAKAITQGIADHSAPKGKGELFLVTTPPGARALVDGAELSGVTPLEIDSLEAGSHRISVRLGALFGDTTVVVRREELLTLNLPLVPGSGGLKVLSSPPGATVQLDRTRLMGSTPLKIGKDIPAGPHRLTFSMDGFLTTERIVQVDADAITLADIQLEPAGRIALGIHPGTRAFLAKDSLELPLADGDTILDVPIGTWIARFEHPDQEPFVQEITIRQGDTLRLAPAMQPRFGAVRVTGTLPGLLWTETDSGSDSLLGPLPFEWERVPPGNHRFKVGGEGVHDTLFLVRIEKGSRAELALPLARPSAWIADSMATFRHDRARNLRILAGAGSIGCALAAIASWRSARDAQDEAERATEEYRTASSGFESFKATNRSKVKKANEGYTRAAAFSAGAAVLAAGFTFTFNM